MQIPHGSRGADKRKEEKEELTMETLKRHSFPLLRHAGSKLKSFSIVETRLAGRHHHFFHHSRCLHHVDVDLIDS